MQFERYATDKNFNDEIVFTFDVEMNFNLESEVKEQIFKGTLFCSQCDRVCVDGIDK